MEYTQALQQAYLMARELLRNPTYTEAIIERNGIVKTQADADLLADAINEVCLELFEMADDLEATPDPSTTHEDADVTKPPVVLLDDFLRERGLRTDGENSP